MKTSYRTEGEKTYFLLSDLDPHGQEGVRNLAFTPYEDGLAKAYPTDTPHLEVFYQQFARAAEAMILQSARVQPVPWEAALQALLLRLEGQHIHWWLAGSCALAARGLDVVPGDLDLVTDEVGSHCLAELLGDVLVGPVEDITSWNWIARWFGRAFLHARIEWIGAPISESDQHGVTEFGPAAASQLEVLAFHGYDLRVPSLAIQLAVNERRGLVSRVQKIKHLLSSSETA
jgi:hypothetical protein